MFKQYFDFIREKKILSSGYNIIFVSMINQIIQKIISEIIIPVTNRKFESEKININEYFALILNLFVSTYVLYHIINFIESN
jgi:large-conductance mechanosensitive channel